MSDAKETLVDFIHQAGEIFGLEQFQMEELEITPKEETTFCAMTTTDLVYVDMDTMYYFCMIPAETEFNQTLVENCFDHFRQLEDKYSEDYTGIRVLWKKWEAEDFWYMQRLDSGEIGLFHSLLSIDYYEDLNQEEGEGEPEDK
jgi:hypothetical protein